MPVNVSFGPAAGLVGQFGFGAGKRQYSDRRDAVERQSKREMLGDAMQFAGFLQKTRAPQQQQQFAMERMNKQAEIATARDQRVHLNQLSSLKAQDALAKARETWRIGQKNDRNRELEEKYQAAMKKINALGQAKIDAGEKPHTVSAWIEGMSKSKQRELTGSGKYADPGEAMAGPLSDHYVGANGDELQRDKGSGKITNLSQQARENDIKQTTVRNQTYVAKQTAQTAAFREVTNEYAPKRATLTSRYEQIQEQWKEQIEQDFKTASTATTEEKNKMVASEKAYLAERKKLAADLKALEAAYELDRAQVRVDSYDAFRDTGSADDPSSDKPEPISVRRDREILEKARAKKEAAEKEVDDLNALFSVPSSAYPSLLNDVSTEDKAAASLSELIGEDDPTSSLHVEEPEGAKVADYDLSTGKTLSGTTHDKLKNDPDLRRRAVAANKLTQAEADEVASGESTESISVVVGGKKHQMPFRNKVPYQANIVQLSDAERKYSLVSNSRDELMAKAMQAEGGGQPGAAGMRQKDLREKEIKKTALWRAHNRLMALLNERKRLLNLETQALAAGSSKAKESQPGYARDLQANKEKYEKLENEILAFEKGDTVSAEGTILGEEIPKLPKPPVRPYRQARSPHRRATPSE